MSLIICLVSGCGHSPWFEIPEKPKLPVATWQESGELYCTDEKGVRLTLERNIIRNFYEAELKEVIKACNKIVEKQTSSWWNPFD
jgi:hypothetical protein